jgi:hypothetical protein
VGSICLVGAEQPLGLLGLLIEIFGAGTFARSGSQWPSVSDAGGSEEVYWHG